MADGSIKGREVKWFNTIEKELDNSRLRGFKTSI